MGAPAPNQSPDSDENKIPTEGGDTPNTGDETARTGNNTPAPGADSEAGE